MTDIQNYHVFSFLAAPLVFAAVVLTLHACQGPIPARAATPCPEGSHERRFECTSHGDLAVCDVFAERWYVCQKGEWVQE